MNCNRIYWNLIEILDNEDKSNSALNFIRELKLTENCTKNGNKLIQTKRKIFDFTGNESVKRIINHKSNLNDKERAKSAINKYDYKTKELLINYLPFYQRF